MDILICQLVKMYNKNPFLTREDIKAFLMQGGEWRDEHNQPQNKQLLLDLKEALLYSKNKFEVDFVPNSLYDGSQYFETKHQWGSKRTSADFMHHCYIPFRDSLYGAGVRKMVRYLVNNKMETRGILHVHKGIEKVELRLSNKEDTNQIMCYIGHELKSYLDETNPFLPTIMGIGYLYRIEREHYFQTIATEMYQYLKETKNQGIAKEEDAFLPYIMTLVEEQNNKLLKTEKEARIKIR